MSKQIAIFLVNGHENYHGCNTLAIFSTLEKAIEYAETAVKEHDCYFFDEIEVISEFIDSEVNSSSNKPLWNHKRR